MLERSRPLHIGYPEGEEAPRTAFIMGDPGRVRLLSGELDSYSVVSDKRGYLIVRGIIGGRDVLLASHGIGGPSLLILAEELRMIGVRRLIRLGSTGAFGGGLGLTDVVLASGACAVQGSCGLSLYYRGLHPPLAASPILLARASGELAARGVRHVVAPVLCSDAFYAEDEELFTVARRSGCVSVDMETAALYGFAWARGVEALSALVVSNVIEDSSEVYADRERLEARFRELFRALSPLA